MRNKYLYTMCIGLLLLLAGCSGQSEYTYRIGVSQCSDDAWRQKMDEEMWQELLFHPDIQLIIRSADDDSKMQSQQIDSFISEQIDLLIVSPNEADGVTDAVSRAYEAGIPVIVADRRVHGDKYTAFIGGDNYQVGKLLAQYIGQLLPDGGDIFLLRGLEGSTPDVLRYQGLTDYLPSNIRIAGERRADWFRVNAHRQTEQFLSGHEVALIVAFNDLMALGAWDVCSGRGEQGVPFIIGVDALSGEGGGIQAVYDGKLTASVRYATAGDLLIQRAVQIREHEPFTRDTVIPALLIDKVAAEPLMLLSKEVDMEMRTISELNKHIDIYAREKRQNYYINILILALFVVTLCFLTYYGRLYWAHKRLSEQLTAARDELEKSTLSKISFFTSVSHEFRTPLTLIADPVRLLSEDESLTDKQRDLARLAHKNSQVLLRLINQTLDFRKFESGKLQLRLSKVNMRDALSEWVKAFEPLARKKHLQLTFHVEENDAQETSDYIAVLDAEKIERVAYNLIANACKFTPANGTINVTLSVQTQTITFAVEDSGPGIPDEHKKHVFDTFYQAEHHEGQGSGIGLSLVRSLVVLHNGSLTLSDVSPHGARFTVVLPKDLPLTEGESCSDYVHITPQQILTELDNPIAAKLTPSEVQKERIMLCIDDNADICNYLQQVFANDFLVLTAQSGTEGLQKAAATVPDIIICDISIPDMDGLQITHTLKTTLATSHIPVILLTAHSLEEQQARGLSYDADAYMTKPFNTDVLRAQVNSLLNNRKLVRNIFAFVKDEKGGTGAQPSKKESDPTAHMTTEEQFLYTFNRYVMEHLDESNLDVETVADAMAMSRTQLYRKVKRLTNFSPNELIRNTRLEHAKRLLMKGDLSISVVAYQTGFTSPSYFTKCYSDYFGHLPSDEKG